MMNYLPLSNDIVPFGLNLEELHYFVRICGDRSSLYDVTPTQINEMYIKPMTRHLQCSYSNFRMKSTDRNCNQTISKATIYVSYTPTCRFLDLIDSLQNYSNKHRLVDAYFWIDIFSLNQHRRNKKSLLIIPSEADQLLPLNIVANIGHTLLITVENDYSFMSLSNTLWSIFSSFCTGFC